MIKGGEKLKECSDDLQLLFRIVGHFVDIRIVEGHRDRERQNELHKLGRTQLRWPDSHHNKTPSEAVDVVPEPVDWNDQLRFYHLAGFVRGIARLMGIDLIWGGDWKNDFNLKNQSFFDLSHYQIGK